MFGSNSFDERQNLYNEFYQKLYKLPFPESDKTAFFKHEVNAKIQLVNETYSNSFSMCGLIKGLTPSGVTSSTSRCRRSSKK